MAYKNENFAPNFLDYIENEKLQSDLFIEYIVNKGIYVFQDQDPADQIFILKSGALKAECSSPTGRKFIKEIFNPGDLFGELALYNTLCTESVTALEPSIVLSIDKEDFKKVLLEQPQINTVVHHIMVKRRMQLEKRFEKLIFMDSRSRILEFLINLAEKEGRAVGFEKEVKINLTHQDIAELNFTSRQKVTILMNELKSKKIISFNRRRILFRDLDQLRTELRPSLLVTSE